MVGGLHHWLLSPGAVEWIGSTLVSYNPDPTCSHMHGPWVGLTTAIGVAPVPGCGGRLGFGLVGRVTRGHVRQGALVRVEMKAPLDRAGLVVVVGALAATTCVGRGREGGGGRRGNNEARW